MAKGAQHFYDVIIAGGGPCGVVAGVALTAAGLDVLVLEGADTHATDLRASTLHAPTLDYLSTFGITQELEPLGLRSPEYKYFNRQTGSCITFDMSELKDLSEHPYRLQCEQWKLTIAAQKRIADRFHFSSRVVKAQETPADVHVTAETPDGVRMYRGRFVVACDGAGSVVRKGLGIGFDGFTYEEKFLCLSTVAPMHDYLPEVCNVNYMSDPTEWLVLLRAPSAWRVLVPAAVDAPDSDLLSDHRKDEVFARLLKHGQSIETLHRTIYRVHQRVARSYRSGRIILAGDAAHLNNPLGGFGMNSAIHDIRNLADKLIRIIKLGESETLLDMYERQRRTVMEEFIQAQSMSNKRAMEMSPELQVEDSENEMRRISENAKLRRGFLLRQSMYSSLDREAEIQ